MVGSVRFALFFLLSSIAVAPLPARAAESFDACKYTVTSLPAVVTSQGTWCLKSDLATLMTAGYAIWIKTSNVILDCNHFKLGGLGAGTGTATTGIRIENGSNVVIRNCNLRGFYTGVHAVNGSGHLIEDNLLDGIRQYGIMIDEGGSMVRGNRLIDVGGSTTITDPIPNAIRVTYDQDLIGNVIDGVYGTGGADVYGILTINSDAGVISGNIVRGLTVQTGVPYGIYNGSSGRVIVQGNHLTDATGTGTAIRCTHTAGLAASNFINGWGTDIDSCTSVGNALN